MVSTGPGVVDELAGLELVAAAGDAVGIDRPPELAKILVRSVSMMSPAIAAPICENRLWPE